MKTLGNILSFGALVLAVVGMTALAGAAGASKELDSFIVAVDDTAPGESVARAYRERIGDDRGFASDLAARAVAARTEEGVSDTLDRRGVRGAALALLSEVVAPDLAYVRVEEGMRVEQVAARLADALGWDAASVAGFVGTTAICTTDLVEGNLKPATYAIAKETPPQTIRGEMERGFEAAFAAIMEETGTPLDERDILTIASLIQREAAGPEDMDIVSGIIWNRIFADMSLDIDATLQYAKVNEIGEAGKEVSTWWPIVRSKDKYIDSPFNTYRIEGLPPMPIATPSEAAIRAAIAPADTTCLFYLHDAKRVIHCADDYKQHKRNVVRFLR